MNELNSIIKANEIYESNLDGDIGSYIGAKLTHKLDRLKRLEEALSEVEGQDHVVEAVKEILFGIEQQQNAKGVLANFLFIGPPASGKSMIAEKIAEALEIPYKRFDMSEYATKDSLVEAIGSDKVYRSAHQGDWTEFVYNNPFSVVVFDEVEKGDPSVLNLFLQMLQEGELKDGFERRKMNFRNVIVIFTSNLGASIYDSTMSRYINSQIPQSTLIKALSSEINPKTGAPFLSSAIVSRLANGNIALFNRLRPEHIHKIVKREIDKNIESYNEEHRIKINVDSDELAKMLIFSLGENADIRALTQAVRAFFKRYFLRSVEAVDENGSLNSFTRIYCDFNKNNASKEAQDLFFRTRKARLAVFCAEHERAKFEQLKNEATEVLYISEGAKINDILRLDASAIIIGTSNGDDHCAKEVFLQASLQDNAPIYVYSQQAIGRISFLYYTDKGATECYYPSATGKSFDTWLQGILSGINLTTVTHEMFRANKVLTYDVVITHSDEKRGIALSFTNYGIKSAMSASDQAKFVAERSIPDVKFDDIIGANEAKRELNTIVSILKNFKTLKREGIRIPRGLLLEGKPGTGKTMLAKALAAECNMPFIEKNGSEFLQKYVGDGPEKVRELFATARRYAPSVIFIDEADAFARSRDAMFGFRTDDILNAFLSEMDGFEDNSDTPVFVIAATNFSTDREDTKLDTAFLRRFDRSIYIDLPSRDERLEFITKSIKKIGKSIVGERCINVIAKRSIGMSLADLNLVIQNSIRRCFTENGIDMLTDEILTEAYEDYVNGGKNEQSEVELQQTAIHEAAHAVLGHVLGLKPVHATIVGRRKYGGCVSFSNEDIGTYSRGSLLDRICCAYAGRVAEIHEYGEAGITTGAGQDIKSATRYAELMVTEYGMIDSEIMYYSSEMRKEPEVISKVRGVLREQYVRAELLVEECFDKIRKIANALLEKNSLDEEEIATIIDGGANDEIL